LLLFPNFLAHPFDEGREVVIGHTALFELATDRGEDFIESLDFG
jgi:hypothetical protein